MFGRTEPKQVDPATYRNPAQIAVEGAKIHSFNVKAKPGFTIKGYHKFFIVKRSGRLVVEYCDFCSAARRILHIDGEDVDYVANTLRHFDSGWCVEDYNPTEIINSFSVYLIAEYVRLINSSGKSE